MKQLTVIMLLAISYSATAQMITANAGIALNFSNDFNYRMAYTHKLNSRFDIGLGVHYVGYLENFFHNNHTNNTLQYKGKGDKPFIWYDEFIRGVSREGQRKSGGSNSLYMQSTHVGIFGQYNFIQKQRWNSGFRVGPNIVIDRMQFYTTLYGSSMLQIHENDEPQPFPFYEKEVVSTIEFSISPSIYVNYKLTPNFWLGIDYTMPVYFLGGADILLSLSVSYLF